ncbi:shikimate dehydrogenase [Paludibacter sp. 221]|uniref:shikimate dehydrogenase family protein n=1 Tax=Paludibacter sp. 221 TaxID=2302939 RepID=UPI001EF3BBDE|nr:shikimate dehydrogenase [Paludibacter sp. 221]
MILFFVVRYILLRLRGEKIYGLIGFPLEHSFSKRYFTDKFKKEKIKARYNLFEIKDISEVTRIIKKQKVAGLNVTIPYKEKVFDYVDDLDVTAKSIGAINVLKITHNKKNFRVKGYNTDAIGFEESIKPSIKPYHKKALILGTGGASKAIKYVLEKLGIETMYVSRSEKEGVITYSSLDEKIMSEYNVIVNATPLGTYPNIDTYPDIPYLYITDKHLLFDVVYNPAETQFLKKGKEQGATIINGEQMLIGQAEAAWKIWNEQI